jgi:hypothetical protein
MRVFSATFNIHFFIPHKSQNYTERRNVIGQLSPTQLA